jgi:AcrR family transcriptional regulator
LCGVTYHAVVPKLWSETIASHRTEVREAILEATAALVAEHGLRGVPMAKIAETAGIGRATLYKYFPDIESILAAWHGEHVAHHLNALAALRDGPGAALERLEALLSAYGRIVSTVAREHHGIDLVTLVHQGPQVDQAAHELSQLVHGLVAAGIKAGEIRGDIPPLELANFCIKAMGGAAGLRSEAAVRRLTAVTIDGLRVRQ